MFTRHLAWSLLVVSCGGSVPAVLAQSAPHVQIANPEAVECRFDAGPSASGAVVRYQVELFRAQDDPAVAPALKSFELATLERAGAGTVRLAMKDGLSDLPDGTYVATVRAVLDGSPSARSVPTAPFKVFGRTTRGVPLIDSTPEAQRSERFWTKVAIAVAGGLLVVPLVTR